MLTFIRVLLAIIFFNITLSCWAETKQLEPEMTVVPVPNQFLAACKTESLLNELLQHTVKKEKTKFEAMFSSYDCIKIPEDQAYKVLSVNRNVVEFTNANSNESVGMWTVIEAFKLKN